MIIEIETTVEVQPLITKSIATHMTHKLLYDIDCSYTSQMGVPGTVYSLIGEKPEPMYVLIE